MVNGTEPFQHTCDVSASGFRIAAKNVPESNIDAISRRAKPNHRVSDEKLKARPDSESERAPSFKLKVVRTSCLSWKTR